MQERIKQIPKQLLEFWNKYSNKQKTIIICVVAAIFMSIVILSVMITKTTYVDLIKSETTSAASDVKKLLDEKGYKSKLAEDKLTIQVDQKNYNDAILLMGENDIPSSGMSFEDAFNNDMSTTESEKSKKYALAFQNEIRSKLLKMAGIKDAIVYINQPVDDYTILSEGKESTVSVTLWLSDDETMTAEKAQSLAVFLANVVGNTSTDLVSIIDSNYNLLFGGSSDSLLGGNINSVIEYKTKLTNNIINNVSKVLVKTGYDDVEVGSSNIKFDMDKVTELYTEYTPAEGQDQGVLANSYNYSSEGTSGSGGVPGTDSNGDETTYTIDTSGNSNNTTDITKNEYSPNERKINTEHEIGAVVPVESSMAIVLTQHNVIKQVDVERQGLLDNTTWEDYVIQNDIRTKLEVDPEVYNTVAMTTGIAANKLQITAWQQPVFQATVVPETKPTDWVMIILAILIVALLIFVVFKGTSPVEVTEMEPELSVEQLLATTKENQSLEDIEFNEKSETRKMIEKFVDENPEAVAQLLRNWLNEDWG